MMVLNNNECKECNDICNAIHFQRNFENWSSGNYYIDVFIQNTQLSAHSKYVISEALEWIPYDRFYDIKYIVTDNKFGEVYRANWIDGSISYWDYYNKNWERILQDMFVTLKSLDNPNNIALEYKNEVF
jgi:hypothetical protein